MKYRLLFGNTIEGSGKRLARVFSNFGFETEYCANVLSIIDERLKETNFNGIIFFAFRITDKVHNFIKNSKKNYPDMKIYPIITTESEQIKSLLKEDGATNCLTTPYTEYSLCGDIINDFYSYDEIPVLPEIADFINKKGFSDRFVGFNFLCCAIELAIDFPEMLNKITRDIYPKTAEKMHTSYGNVERSIRVLSTEAFRGGIELNGKLTYRKPTNKELIRLLSEEYIKLHGL